MKKRKKKNFIVDYIEDKKKEKKKKELEAKVNKNVELVIRIALTVVLSVIGVLLLAICALDGEIGAINTMTYIRGLLGILFFGAIPLVWIYNNSKKKKK